MPSDYLDYNNNLAFPPKSADDLNEQKRESDVLITAIEKCEKLEKQLKIAVEALKEIYEDTKSGHIQCDACNYTIECEGCVNQDVAERALEQIKELDNHG